MFSVLKSFKNRFKIRVQNRTPFRNVIFSVLLPLGSFQDAFLRDCNDFLRILGALPGTQNHFKFEKYRPKCSGVCSLLASLRHAWFFRSVLGGPVAFASLRARIFGGLGIKNAAFRTQFFRKSKPNNKTNQRATRPRYAISRKQGPAVLPPPGGLQ